MGKKSTGKHYVSKGERRNVSRKTRNMLRADKRANPDIEDVLKSLEFKTRIIDKPKGAKEKALQERYINEENTQQAALKIYEQYEKVGITWAACVQAVKTNFGEQLHTKWRPILKNYKDSINK